MLRACRAISARAMRDKTEPHVVRVPLHARARHRRGRAAPDHRARIGQAATASTSTSASSPSSCAKASSIRDYDKPPFTDRRRQSAVPGRRKLRELFGHLPCEFHATSIRAAEMVKYCCNNFHALKITFANETARLCEALGVDPFEVMDLRVQGHAAQHLAGLSASRASRSAARACRRTCARRCTWRSMRDVELPMLGGILASNRVHIEHAIDKVLATGKRRIGMIGLSFKTGTDDLRESPLVTLAEHLIGKGLSLLGLRSRSAPVAPARRQPALHRAARAAHRQPDSRNDRRSGRASRTC